MTNCERTIPLSRRAFLALMSIPALAMVGCGAEPRVETVPGPEDPNLLKELTGHIVRVQPGGGIEAFKLPQLSKSVVRAARNSDSPNVGAVRSVSGPGAKGEIAFIDNFMFSKQHSLSAISVDGKGERSIWTRTGDALWDHVISRDIALSRDGKLVAFVSGLKNAQMDDPPALLEEGELEVWDLTSGTGLSMAETALDGGLSWFPDGRRLAISVLRPRTELGELPLKPDGFGREFNRWQRVPIVYILDAVSGKLTRLHVGWFPVVSSDGKHVIVSDLDYQWRNVNVSSGNSSSVKAPGSIGAPIAFLDERTVIYPGLPTEGTAAKKTESNSPLVGPKPMMTIKAAKLNTGKFVTLIPYHDMRRDVSYGQ